MLASGYCMADVIDKGYKTYKNGGCVLKKEIFVNSFDAIVWQFLASVFVPGFIINRTVEFSTWSLTKMQTAGVFKSAAAVRWLPVVIGVCTIPFIVEPIDHSITKAMDKTIR